MSETKTDKFQTSKRNVELEIVQKDIELLRKYVQAKGDNKRKKIHEQMHAKIQILLNMGYTPDYLIPRLEKAIKLDKFRPKNTSLGLLSVNEDLDYINGEFDTFDRKLGKLGKDIDKNAGQIRNRFNAVTENRDILSEQFAQDWIRRLGQHKDLVDKVSNANSKTEKIAAYNELFCVLVKDFCQEYNIPEESVYVEVVENWEKRNISSSEEIPAFVEDAHGITYPGGLSAEEKKSILEEFKKSPKTYPGAYEKKLVWVNFDSTNKNAKNTNIPTFVLMLVHFAHEMSHVLDRLKPREGALGPQTRILDAKTYVSQSKNEAEYHKSATELAAYHVTGAMARYLKDFWRE